MSDVMAINVSRGFKFTPLYYEIKNPNRFITSGLDKLRTIK
jgi:hypothetical protein